MKEKFNLIADLRKRAKEFEKSGKESMMGLGDFPGMNSLMRATMNTKHHTQHLTLDNPEYPFIFNGTENLVGENSSFYMKANKDYEIVDIVKKYNELLNGRVYFALYFMHCKKDDSYIVVERQECENLTEDFGFDYNNDVLDECQVGDVIPEGTVVYASTSYDEDMNVSSGINGRILYGVHPAVQDDAILVSESFANRLIANQITSKTIPVNENTIFVNMYGDKVTYQGLPNIGDVIGENGEDGIICATRQIKESRMFSDLRDSALTTINHSSDQIFYGEGEVIDINIYCNNPNLKVNKINKQLIQYHNDLKFYYSEIFKACRKIIRSGSKNIDQEIFNWERRAKEYLDEEAKWDFNDNVFSNMMVQILLRKKSPALIGQKITGRHGNKTVISSIVPDDEMPFTTMATSTDKYGRVQPVGEKKPVDLVTNPLAIINRMIPMALFEASMSFILGRTREHMATMDDAEEAIDFMFEIIAVFNKEFAKNMRDIYDMLTPHQKKMFLKDCIERWVGIEKRAFDDNVNLRDAIISIYQKYADIYEPYDLFVPKREWKDAEHPNGRDIYVGKYHIGYQYIMMLKQSGEHGFSVRDAGSISEEALPEKSNSNKTGRLWRSETPIRFGEYKLLYSLNCVN